MLFSGIVLLWCHNPLKDILNPIEWKSYSEVVTICEDNDGILTTDELWNNICLFNALDWCLLEKVEAWTCEWINDESDESDYLDSVTICEDNGWKIVYDETEKESPMCYFLEAEWCSLASIERGDCEFLSYEYNSLGDWVDEYPIWEQLCIDNGGQVSQTEDGIGICILNDDDFCYLEDLEDWWCDLWPVYPTCPEDWTPVCWKDWNTYSNRCFLEASWVEEDTEAEVTEDWCIFG